MPTCCSDGAWNFRCTRPLIDDAEVCARRLTRLSPAELRPCHCDPTGANLLNPGERVWLVDWEYSGMNDPAWDLAYLSVEADFDAALDGELLTAYFGRLPGAAQTGRVEVYKALCELLSALWALIQVSNCNAVADFRSYAERTFEPVRAKDAVDGLREPSRCGADGLGQAFARMLVPGIIDARNGV